MTRPMWSRRTIRGLALGAFVLLLVASAPAVDAPPVPPMRVDGSALDAAGAPLALGTRIRASFDGVDYSNESVVLDAAGSFSLLVDGNSRLGPTSDTPTIKEGLDPDEVLVFAAGDFATTARVFEEVLAWRSGVVATQALNLASGVASPAPLKIQGIVTRSALASTQYVLVCNPTSTPVDLADYLLEVNRPGVVRGPKLTLTGSVGPNGVERVNLSSLSFLTPTGDALKLVYDNPGGLNAPAAGADVVMDRVEFNATTGGTLTWEPGNTILGDAPAPLAGDILERTAACADTDDPGDFRLAPEPGLPTRPSDPFAGLGSVLLAAMVVVVIAAILLIAYWSRRSRARPPPRPLPQPPSTAPPAAPPPATQSAPPGDTKRCPRCGTTVHERDWTCFFCGHRFDSPP